MPKVGRFVGRWVGRRPNRPRYPFGNLFPSCAKASTVLYVPDLSESAVVDVAGTDYLLDDPNNVTGSREGTNFEPCYLLGDGVITIEFPAAFVGENIKYRDCSGTYAGGDHDESFTTPAALGSATWTIPNTKKIWDIIIEDSSENILERYFCGERTGVHLIGLNGNHAKLSDAGAWETDSTHNLGCNRSNDVGYSTYASQNITVLGNSETLDSDAHVVNLDDRETDLLGNEAVNQGRVRLNVEFSDTLPGAPTDYIAAYLFNANNEDETSNYDLTGSVSYVNDRNAVANSAASFNGSQKLVNETPINIDLNQDFSISFFYKANDQTTKYQGRLFAFTSDSSNNPFVSIYSSVYSHEEITFRVNCNDDAGSSFAPNYSTVNFTPDSWVHFCLVKSGNNWKVYVNKSLEFDENDAVGTFNNWNRFTIGALFRQATESQNIDCIIDDFKIFDYELTTTDINNLADE